MMSTQQKALFLDAKFGNFVLGNLDIPTPGHGELLVELKAVGLNPFEWKIQKYGVFVDTFPAVIGVDAAGDVVEVGEGVTNFSKGDRVFFLGALKNDRGAFQQFTKTIAVTTAKIPASISYDQAATISMGLTTAYFGLYHKFSLGFGIIPPLDASSQGKYSGTPLVILGGSSSVGQYAIQLAKASGFSPIITTSSLKHTEYLKSLGATHVIDRHIPLTTEIENLTTGPIEFVYDAISTEETQRIGYDLLAPSGQIAIVLPLAIPETEKTVVQVLASYLPQNYDIIESLYVKLAELIEDGVVKPNRLEILPGGLNAVVGGLERLEKDQVSGVKLVIHPQDTIQSVL